MRKTSWPVFLVAGLLISAALACSFSFSSAKIENERLATDQEGDSRTTIFAPEDTIYVVLDLKSAPPETKIQAVWTLIEAEGEEPNTELLRSPELETGSAEVWFSLTPNPDSSHAIGTYKVELFIDDEREKTLNFEVQAAP